MTQSHFPFTVRRDFGATDYNSSIVGAAPAQRLYGMQTKQLQYPVGTSENLVLQNLDPQSESPTMAGSTYAAEVQGFSTGLDCEILQLGNATKKFLPWFSIQAPYFVVNITTDSCHIENAIVGQGADHGYYKNDSATESYQGLFQNFTCNTGADNSLKFHPSGDSTMDHRFLLSMALLQWTPHIPVSEASHIWVKQLTGVLCKPTYSIDNYSVSYKQAQDAPTMQATKIPGTNSTLEGFDNSQLTQAVQTSLEKASFGQGGAEYVVVAVPSIFQLMEVMNNASTLRPFLDPNLLLTLGSRVFQGVSSQVASQYLMKPLNSTTYGSLTHTEDRLQVKPLTVGLMATCLGLLVCIAMLEVFIRPWSTVCVEPKTISSLARILAASGSLREYLTCMGSATLNTLQCRLSQDKFQTVIAQDKQRSFVLEHLPQSTEPNEIPLSAPPDSKLEWWRPMAVKGWFGALAIIIPLCLIILLEVLQRESDKKGGLLGVATSGVDSHILSTYLPALVMLGVATMYSSLDFAISIFVPLAALRRGNGTAAQSIMVSTVGSHPLHAFLLSLRTRSGTRCITIFAGFVASFLTVVVSALYNVGTVTKSHEVSLQQGDFFNWNHVDLSLDDKFAGVITDLIVYSNTSYPQWTYDNLVFPSLTPSSANNATSSNDSASVVVTVPAIRGSLSCSAVPPTSIKVSARGALPSCTTCNDLVELDYQVFLPSNLCGLDAKNLNMTGQTLSWSHSYAVPNDSSQVYAGLGTDLQWAQEYITGEGVVAPGSTYSTDNYMSGCPSFAFSLGTANAGTRTNKTMGDGLAWTSQQDINFMICHQQLEQVMTNVSLSYPDLRVIRTSPPVPLESTATVIIKGNTDNWFHISLNTFINALQDLGTSVTGRNGINGFIQALVWGKNGIPIEQLYNNGDVSTTLTTAANRIYGQYIAQAISANMRTTVPPISQDPSLPNNQTHPTYTATLSQPYQRLQQNRGPKIALQVMLSFMAVCAIATHILMETARVVPHNPCSIAGMMSLLADSELCGTRTLFPKGSEWKSDAELRRESIYEGLLFRIGWWEKVDEGMGNGQGRRRVYGIDVVRTLGDDHS
ncbi:MAG: hypothetical protein M1830_007144 [Pleopsidium flavum]|nr:MAG: hypothetical protein M1830_007144 [Pleopsidium flavum]